MAFVATGVFEYDLVLFLSIVAVARGAHYAAIGILAKLYGRRLARIFCILGNTGDGSWCFSPPL